MDRSLRGDMNKRERNTEDSRVDKSSPGCSTLTPPSQEERETGEKVRKREDTK